MVVAIMRHGRRGASIDGALLGFDLRRPEQSCPEIWESLRTTLSKLPFTAIVVSPYLRTRQTAELVQYGYQQLTGRTLPIRIDTRIGEYLEPCCSWKLPNATAFDSQTRLHFRDRVPLRRESYVMMQRRVCEFWSELRDDVLIITHAGIAQLLGSLEKKEITLQPGEVSILKAVSELRSLTSY